MKNEEANKQPKREGMIRKLPAPLIAGLILAVILSGGIAFKVSSVNQNRQNAELIPPAPQSAQDILSSIIAPPKTGGEIRR